VSSVPKAGLSRGAYSRVVGERGLQMLGQPLEVVPEFLELAVSHRRVVRRVSKIQGARQGSVPRAAVAAWRRAARRPPGTIRGKKMSLTLSTTLLRRRANATQPLLIPAWQTSRACSRGGGQGLVLEREERNRERKGKVKRELSSRVNVWLHILILHLALNTATTENDDNIEHGLTRGMHCI